MENDLNRSHFTVNGKRKREIKDGRFIDKLLTFSSLCYAIG